MAVLVSPGVNVSVVDESAYGAPGAGTVPLLMVATRQDKTDPTGSEADGIAKFTKSTQAGKVTIGVGSSDKSSGTLLSGDLRRVVTLDVATSGSTKTHITEVQVAGDL